MTTFVTSHPGKWIVTFACTELASGFVEGPNADTTSS